MNYVVTVSDNIKDSVSQKLLKISDSALQASRGTEKLQDMLGKSKGQDKYIYNQQKIAKSQLEMVTSANRATMSQAKLETQALKTAAAMNRLSKQQTDTAKSILIGSARIISAISRWASLLGIGFSLKFIIAFGDSLISLNNKLRNATTSAANFRKVSDEVFAAANRAKVPVADLGQTYQRIDSALKNLGMSQKQALTVTETAAKALSLSGATAEESGAALLQLSQAFNKGKLDGDEFRTVMELMPPVADALAKQLGVTRGELLNLAPQGKITAQVMADAFTKLSVDVDKQFSKITPTIGGSLTVLRNNALKAFGEFDKATGFTETWSKAILNLANNLDKVIPIVATLGTTIAAYIGVTAVQALGKAIVSGTLFNAVLSVNPLVAFVTGITAVVSALAYFSDQIKIGQDDVITLRDYGIAVFEALKFSVRQFVSDSAPYWETFKKYGSLIFSELWDLGKFFLGKILNFFKSIINTMVTGASQFVYLFTAAWNNLPLVADSIFTSMHNLGVDMIEALANKFVDFFNWLSSKANSMPGNFLNIPTVSAVDMSDARRKDGFFHSASDIKAMQTDLMNGMQNLDRDHLGKLLGDMGDGLYAIGTALGEAHAGLKESAGIIAANRKFWENNTIKDTQFDAQRQAGAAGSLSGDGSGKTKKVKELSAEDQARKRFLDVAKSYVNKDTQAIADKWGISVTNACAAVVRKVGDEAKVSLGVSKNPIDGLSANQLTANSFFGQDVARVFTDVKKVKPGDLVAIEDAANKWIQHVGIVSSIVNGDIRMIDNSSSKGRVMERSTSSVGRIKAFATPNAFLDEKATKAKFSEQESAAKAAERLQKAFDTKINKGNSDLLKILDFDYLKKADAIEDINKEVAKATLRTQEYNDALAHETKLLQMNSDEADTYAKWLDYIKDYKGEANLLDRKEFDQIVNTNRELERQKAIKDGILQNSKIQENKDFNSSLEVLKKLTGEELNVGVSSVLNNFLGINTDELANEFNQILGQHQTFYDRLKAMKEAHVLSEKQYDDLLKYKKLQDATEILGVTENLFSSLVTISKNGNKELVAVTKAAGIAQTLIQTYVAAQLAFKQGAEMGGLPVAIIYAAAAVAQGLARVQQIRTQGTEGFMKGGYTGDMARNQVAGVVHGQEFVMNAQATQRIGVANLQRLQDGGALQSYNPPQQQQTQPGPVVVNTAPPNITIVSSKEAALAALKTSDGTRSVLEIIENEKTAIVRMLS